jgi:hypothetical protein
VSQRNPLTLARTAEILAALGGVTLTVGAVAAKADGLHTPEGVSLLVGASLVGAGAGVAIGGHWGRPVLGGILGAVIPAGVGIILATRATEQAVDSIQLEPK